MKEYIKTNILLLCGAIACPIFIIVVLIEGVMRPNYNSFLYPLSSLSIGNSGWTWMSLLSFHIVKVPVDEDSNETKTITLDELTRRLNKKGSS